MTQDELKTRLSRAFDDSKERELGFKSMFGGACAYVNGRVFASLSSVGLALKIDGETAKEWLEHGAKWLQYDGDAPISKSYLVVPDSVLNDEAQLSRWVERSTAFALSLPSPKPKSARKAAP